ncbi:MAG TPA: amidohydrolase family protein [Polyangiaceae bacterium]|nr:amidohydrolase family protein [Polyangiaceae bacterium]
MKTPRFIKMRKRSEPDLPERGPIWLGNNSNGEYFHQQTPYERKLHKFILQKCDENARKLGMSRRDFLASAMGMTTSLWCINMASGCSSDHSIGHNVGKSAPKGDGGMDSGSARPAACKGYNIEPEMMYDEQAACAAISGSEFIFDIQTHYFETDGQWIKTNPGYVNVIKVLTGTSDFGQDHYLDLIFCQSDTKVAVLTCWPGVLCNADASNLPCGLPMSTDGAAAARDAINKMANSQRLLSHAMILPDDPSGVQAQLDIMEHIACTSGVSAWKLYPAFGYNGMGFFMDDPATGIPVIEKGLELNVKNFAIHKGLPIPGFDIPHNDPRDIGPVAAMYPTANFIIYHAAINANMSTHEGPYVEGDTTGVNALITSMKANGIGPNQNVFAELGSSWIQVMTDATQAAHYLGKLLKYVGENNVCWGTDSMVYGTPQPQIEALRAATIPQDLQDQYGYPALTDDIKAKIFGLNSAVVYGVDPKQRHCQIEKCQMSSLKQMLDDELGARRWTFQEPYGPRTYVEYLESAEKERARGRHA